MADVFTVFKILLWLLSFGGLCLLCLRALKLPAPAAPLAALSSASVLLTFSGMLGVLLPAAAALYALGFLIVAFEIIRRFKLKTPFSVRHPALILIVLVWLVYCFFRLGNYLPYENDDLSHWALAAREILRTNAFPNAATEILSFSSYPLSAAVNIYYFCRFVGESEWLFAYAQAFYRLIAFLPLLALIRKNRLFGYVSFVLAFLFISRAGGYIVSLRVDPLLTAYGIGAFAMGLTADKRKPLAALLPVMMMLTLTKNSGIFFALATAVLAAYLKNKRFDAKTFLLGAGASGLTLVSWLLYVKCTFPAGLSTKHAVSLSAYLENALDKGVGTTLRIAGAFGNALLSPLPSDLLIYAVFALALALMLLAIHVFRKRSLIKPLKRMLAFLALAYASWLIFLFLMYVVSMPEKEALTAASFTRYHRTITLYMGGIALAFVYAISCHEKIVLTKERKIWVGGVTALLLALTIVSTLLDSRSGIILSTKQDRSGRRMDVIEQREKYGICDEKAYLIFCAPDESETENNTDSLYYLYKYEFSSVNIGLIYEGGAEGNYIYHTYDNKRKPMPVSEILPEIAGRYDYLIFHEENGDFLREILPHEGEIGLQILADH